MQNAQGSDSTQLTDAEADITAGASVLVIDPLDSGVGAQIESYAKSHGVAVIDYDRLTLGGSRAYYVSFNNVKVGTLLGKGLVSLRRVLGRRQPNVIVMRGRRDRQQRHPLRPGLQRRAGPVFHLRQVDEVAATGRHVDAGHRRDRVPAGLHRPPERQRGADPQ